MLALRLVSDERPPPRIVAVDKYDSWLSDDGEAGVDPSTKDYSGRGADLGGKMSKSAGAKAERIGRHGPVMVSGFVGHGAPLVFFPFFFFSALACGAIMVSEPTIYRLSQPMLEQIRPSLVELPC